MTKKAFFLVVLLLCPLFMFGQNGVVVNGTVVDETNEGVPGASIVEKGTTNGTSTDANGAFELRVSNPNAVLVVSYIGYQNQEIRLNGQRTLNINLQEDIAALGEIVVTGYGGTQLRSKVTNSIAKVDEKAFQVGVHSNPARALSGAISGVRVVQSSGDPTKMPSIVLRGGTNLDGSGAPLVIVDGQLRENLNNINPEDIESMDMLKDAGATALYGARASNGVILISTKRGREGRSEINFKVKTAWNYAYLPYKFLDAEGYIHWMRTAYNNLAGTNYSGTMSNLTSATSAMGIGRTKLDAATVWNIMTKTGENSYLLQQGWKEMADPITGTPIIYRSTNPADYNLNNPSMTQDYNVNMSGGNNKGTYYAGLGFNDTDGLARTTYYKRLSFVFNGDYNITGWLKSSSSLNFIRSKYRSMTATNNNESSYFGRILSTPPTVRYEDEDGNMLLGNSTGDGNQNFQNDKFLRDNENDRLTMIQAFDIKFTKDLKLSVAGNWYYNEYILESFNKDYKTNQAGTAVNRTRSTSATFQRTFAQTYNAILNYRHTFNRDHNVDLMLGTEYYDRAYKYFYAAGQGAPTDDFQDLGLTSTDENKRTIDSEHEKYRILSYFGRLNYDYAGKYLLSATFREDGYSALLDNRWGFFPGISAGWVFYNEDFFKDLNTPLSFGKLRFSYGLNGNATGIGAYDLQGSYGSTAYNGNTGFLIGALPNPSLRWEKTKTFEVGADVSFWNNRLNANFTFYNRLTDDKYASLSLPSTTGFSSITNNNGQFRNRGVELELSGKIMETKDFVWDAKFNIAYNKNKIIKLPDNDLPRNRQNGVELYTGKGNETEWFGGYQEGQEPGLIYGYKVVKMFRNDNDFPTNYKVTSGHWNGYTQYTPADYAKLTDAEKRTAVLLQKGDLQWADINGDGVIDSKDQVVIGNTIPHWTGGFNTTFRWKGLSLYARFDYALGFWTMDSNANSWRWFMGCMQGAYNAPTDVWDTWTPENPNAKYPRYTYADQFFGSNYYRDNDMFAWRGDYLAIRELSLSYAFPEAWLSKIFVKHLELSITGQNLGYLTKTKVVNPEVGGVSTASYTLPRTLLLGASITF